MIKITKSLFLLIALSLFTPITCQATPSPLYVAAASQSTRSLESRYLREARKYRAEGRYELARQSYVLALSVCSHERRLSIIRQELDGVELLLRTLR
ncbi:MAG: hypothetical protein IJU40_06825 [Desulfovibrionaceae bacterium]|nr:hypothetical protein [Desulfovibrionaceae bacterium]